MSVAFRRESDEEHLEPKFELPIPPGPNFVTSRGSLLIDARVTELEHRLSGSLTDDERTSVLRDLRYWRHRKATAQLAPAPSGDRVAIGTRVTYVQEGSSKVIEIVGHDESEPATARVSFMAPLSRAILDGEVGDEIDLPNGQKLTIVAIACAGCDQNEAGPLA